MTDRMTGQPGGTDHGMPVRIGLTHLGRDQVAMVEMMLGSEGVGHVIDGDRLIVASANGPAAHRIVRTVEERGDTHVAWFDPMPEPETRVKGVPVASRLLRLAGWIVDTMFLRVCGLMAVVLGASVWAVLVLEAFYWIVCTAWSGRTLGKRLVGTRVVHGSGRSVGVVAATVRYSVTSAATWASTLLVPAASSDATEMIAATAASVWLCLVYGLVLSEPLHMGLHDRAARTIVVVERRRRRRD